MPRKHRKPGRGFWFCTGTIGTISPEKAANRVNSKVTDLNEALDDRDSRNGVLESDNASLHKELNAASAEIRRLRRALHLETVVTARTTAWGEKSADDEVDTLSIPVVN